MMFRVAKLISANIALVFRRFVSAARVLSGLFALLRLPLDSDHVTPEPAVRSPAPVRPKPRNEWEQRAQAIASLAKQEVAEILPGWSIDIHASESPYIQCYEFALRAVTPPEWSWVRDGVGGCPVPGFPRQEWGARVSVSFMEIHRSQMVLAQLVLRKLSEFARDIRRKAPAPRSPSHPVGFDLLAVS